MRILVSTVPVDMRKQIDGLAAYCRLVMRENPMSGTVFVFTNRSRKMIRILVYDDQGFWLATKRLSSHHFPFWPDDPAGVSIMQAHEVLLLLRGGDPKSTATLGPWKKISGPVEQNSPISPP
jgi:transposase